MCFHSSGMATPSVNLVSGAASNFAGSAVSRAYEACQTRHAPTCLTSDKASYVAHGLALLNEMRTWGVVREGCCQKKPVFSSTTIAGRKRAFSVAIDGGAHCHGECKRWISSFAAPSLACLFVAWLPLLWSHFGIVFSGILLAFQSVMIVLATAL